MQYHGKQNRTEISYLFLFLVHNISAKSVFLTSTCLWFSCLHYHYPLWSGKVELRGIETSLIFLSPPPLVLFPGPGCCPQGLDLNNSSCLLMTSLKTLVLAFSKLVTPYFNHMNFDTSFSITLLQLAWRKNLKSSGWFLDEWPYLCLSMDWVLPRKCLFILVTMLRLLSPR